MHPSAVIIALLAVAIATAGARIITKHEVRGRQLEAAKRWHTNANVPAAAAGNVQRSGVQNITFMNPKASGK